eukprot:TRINITY_DN2058_c0_g1_i1.p1 TRINITY_DN2058_c0_g1~~TRINITY_DN2058_c0_g1_i1.p1  ORF type:complete len:230 (+),score=51.47 TRINITY_DN2058_c0_g1_i1:252-941(+)
MKKEAQSETEMSLQAMWNNFPKKTYPNIPPICMYSQLYSFVKNRSDVDKNLDKLKREGKVRIFKLLSGKNDFAVVSMKEYINVVELSRDKSKEKPSIFDNFISKVIPNYIEPHITKKRLLDLLFDGDKDENHISAMVNAGILLMDEADSFWFAIPLSGAYVASLSRGRKEILSMLKRQKFKELLLRDMEKKKLRYSTLSVSYLVKDMLGSGSLESVPTTVGPLLRMSYL